MTRHRGDDSRIAVWPDLKRYELAHAIDWFECTRVSKVDIEEFFAADTDTRRELYGNLPEYVHRFLGPDGEGHVMAAPRVDPGTLWASVRWARRQWTKPSVRWRGEGPFPSPVHQKPRREEAAEAENVDPRFPAVLSIIPSCCFEVPQRSSRALF